MKVADGAARAVHQVHPTGGETEISCHGYGFALARRRIKRDRSRLGVAEIEDERKGVKVADTNSHR